MSKNKDSSGPKKDDVDNYLSSYLSMKSPLIGQLEFDASVLPPPVDPKFIDYEINDEIVKYKLTSLEFSERLSTFSDFNCGISDVLLHGTSFTGCGIENQNLMDSIEASLLKNIYSNNDSEDNIYSNIKNDMGNLGKYFESLKMTNLVNKSKESLPTYIQNLLSTNIDASLLHSGKMNMYRDLESRSSKRQSTQSSQHSSLSNLDSLIDSAFNSSPTYASSLRGSDPSGRSPQRFTTRGALKDWEAMSVDERIDAYLSELEKTFVESEELVHPTKKYLKKAKVYDLVPNSKLWNNKYIQVGIDGVSVGSDANSKLEVEGVLRLAKETQTQRFFEYYKPYELNGSTSFSSSNSEDIKGNSNNLKEEAKRVKREEEEGIDDLFAEDEAADEQDSMLVDDQLPVSSSYSTYGDDYGHLYKFIRQYTSQKVSKSSGSENYFLLTLPNELSEKLNTDQTNGSNRGTKASLKESMKQRVKEEGGSHLSSVHQVEVVPIRGPKLVFSKAGVTKRPDIRIAYIAA